MTWESKLMRTVRVQNDQVFGRLAHLITTIAEQGGNVSEIHLIKVHQAVTRAVAEKAVEQGLARAECMPYLD